MKKIRCAIYTRKSSDDGLEQEFNSLDAQREACASYIASQKHEGWVLLPDHYDDGGISGGTLERPGLQRLLANIDEGLVDQIVVYKIDRLTRSLADFAKLVDRLDSAHASFVSVTQSFNTSTSMGRLTLNVLLSFAQFEREVTAERIRDKIAASKKKGLWMGGTVPLGYEPDGRTLRIVESEARTVRTLYGLYQTLHSIDAVKKEADRLGLLTKKRSWNCRSAANPWNEDGGNEDRSDPNVQTPARRKRDMTGSRPFERSHVHYILANPVYAGRIRHRDKVHDGQHPAIIQPDVWDMVQQQLIEHSGRKRGSRGNTSTSSALIGKLFDEHGQRLTPTHANKKGRRYRYYVSKSGSDAATDNNGSTAGGWRIPAPAFESQLADTVSRHLRSRLANGLFVEPDIERIQKAVRLTKEPGNTKPAMLDCIAITTLKPGSITIKLDAGTVARCSTSKPMN